MKVLWLDDDAPANFLNIGSVNVQTAGSCKEAAELLFRGDLPDWLIVDLIVPQGGWGESALKLPGLNFIEFVSSQYRERIQIAAYSIVMPDEMARILRAAGATKCYAKSNHSLMQIIEDLRNTVTENLEHANNLRSDFETLHDFPFQTELKEIVEKLLERISLSTQAVTKGEIAQLHKAKLAIENDAERRLRSYQTLEALEQLAESEAPDKPESQLNELEQLQHTVQLIINHKRTHQLFDVFLSYNSANKEEVELIAVALKANAILPWFDRWEIKPGARWQNELAKQIESISCAAVFIGESHMGPWHEQEMEALLIQFAKRQCPIIPVLLPSAGSVPVVPVFLRGANMVDFRQPNPDSLQRLLWAIIG